MKLTESFCQASSLWFPYTVFLTSVNFKNDGFFFLTNMQDVNWWTGVILSCFYEPFGLSFWRHPFTAKEPLRKYCYAKFLQICSDEETNSSTFWMAWGWVHFQQIFILGELFLQVYSTPLFYLRFQYHRNHCALTTREDLIWTPQYLNCISCTETGYF